MSARVDAEKTYRAIGRFVFEFSQVEYTIRHYLASEIDLKEEYFTAVMESYDVALLCAVAKQVLIKSHGEEGSARIRELLGEVYRLNAERVRVAHGLWVPHREGGTVHHVSRSNLKPAWYANQAEALEKKADELNALRAALEREFTAVPQGSSSSATTDA
jgi:hypothetical protein